MITYNVIYHRNSFARHMFDILCMCLIRLWNPTKNVIRRVRRLKLLLNIETLVPVEL